MRFQKYAFSLSSKTHRSIRIHTSTLPFWCVFDCPHQGSVHTNAFSKVCVFVVIENASIDSRSHYLFDAFLTVHTKVLSVLIWFQKYAFSLSSKTHRSFRVHTTFWMRFWLSTLRSCLYLFGFKSMRFRCHRKRVDRFASILPFWCVFD